MPVGMARGLDQVHAFATVLALGSRRRAPSQVPIDTVALAADRHRPAGGAHHGAPVRTRCDRLGRQWRALPLRLDRRALVRLWGGFDGGCSHAVGLVLSAVRDVPRVLCTASGGPLAN